MLRVQSKQCATCIYRRDSPLDLRALEAQVADPFMPGHFAGFRICHHSDDAACRGFWNRHRDACTPMQIAHRLGLVEFVKEEK